MLKGKTKSGFEYEIQQNALENYELVEALSELDENTLAITKVINLLIGDEQKNALKEHVRDEDGIVPITALTNEITEIMNNHQEVKK